MFSVYIYIHIEIRRYGDFVGFRGFPKAALLVVADELTISGGIRIYSA